MDYTKIKQYPTQLSNVFKRFPLPMGLGCFSALYAMFLFRMAENNEFNFIQEHPRYFIWIAVFSVLSIFLTTATKLLQESMNLSPKKGWIITGASEAALGALTAGYIANGDLDNLHFIAQSVVWSAIVVLSPLIVPFFKDKDDFPLWNFIGKSTKSFLTSTITTLLFYGAMAVLAVCASILQLPIHELFFFDMGAISICIVFPILYFASLPNLNEPNENSEVSRYFSNTIHFLFMPVLIVYIFFVYAYAIQVRDLGALGFMALAAVISTILICGILYPGHFKDNFDKAFLKSVPWVTIPLTFISAWGISDIFTDADPDAHFVAFYIITALIWLLASLIILLVDRIKKKIWWTMVSLCATAIVATMFSINIFNLKTFVNPRHNDECEMCEYKEYLEEQALAGDVSDCDINDCTEASVDSVVAIPDTITEIEIRWDHETRNIPTEFPAGKNKIVFVDYRYIQDSLFILKNDTIHITLDLTKEDNGCASCGNAEENCADSTQAREQKDVREEFAIPLASLVDSANSDNAGTSRTAVVNHPVVYDNGNATLVIKKGTFNHSTASEYGSATISGALFLK